MAYKVERGVDFKKEGGKNSAGHSSSGSRWSGMTKQAPDKSASISKLSHDIRTQLYIIIGFAELMLEEVPGKINEEQRRNLNDVLTSGKRLQAMLNDVVERSKNFQNGKGP